MIRIFFLCCLMIFSFGCTKEAAQPSSQYIESGQAKLRYQTMGQGSPLIVLHGGPGLSQDYLLPQMERLAQNHFVIFYDQRGSGSSEGGDTDENLRMDVFVEDVEAIRKHFGFPKVSIVGHSWGGLLAIQFAISHPESVDKLILLHPSPATAEGWACFLQEWEKRNASSITETLTQIQSSPEFSSGNPEVFSDFLQSIFRTYFAKEELVQELNLQTTRQGALHWIHTCGVFNATLFSSSYDFSKGLSTIPCKTLIIHGDQDPVPLSTIEHIHQSIPSSELLVLKDCGHFSYIEQPEQLFSAINAFLEE